MDSAQTIEPRIIIDNLAVTFATDEGPVEAVRNVSLDVAGGEILVLVGESGSGKTVTARSVLGFTPEAAGTIIVDGKDVLHLRPHQLRELRGTNVSMIFQESSSAMNPVYPIWWQMGEGIRAHDKKIKKKEIKARCVEALRAVGIPHPEKRINH